MLITYPTWVVSWTFKGRVGTHELRVSQPDLRHFLNALLLNDVESFGCALEVGWAQAAHMVQGETAPDGEERTR